MQIKKADVDRKTQKDKADTQLAVAKLELEKEKLGISSENEANRLAAQGKQAADSHKLDFLRHFNEVTKPQKGE